MGFWEPLFFWIFAIGAFVTSLAVIVLRNPLYSALALIVDFFFFAGLYVLLSAHFIAVVQVLVYGGAIMVLFLFIIMLLNLRQDELGGLTFSLHQVAAVAGAVALFFFAGAAIIPLVDQEAVDTARAEAAEQQAQLEEGEDRVALQVASPIPGLYAQINEEALHQSYRNTLQAYAANTDQPWAGKYRPFDPEQPVEVPPALLPEQPAVGVAPIRENLFGTFLPISVLLVGRFVIPFELTAVLLLAAIVGAVIIAKRRVTS